MSPLTPRLRNEPTTNDREPRQVPTHQTALYRGALLLIKSLDAENADLRSKLARYEAHEGRLTKRSDWTRDGRPDIHDDETQVIS